MASEGLEGAAASGLSERQPSELDFGAADGSVDIPMDGGLKKAADGGRFEGLAAIPPTRAG